MESNKTNLMLLYLGQ